MSPALESHEPTEIVRRLGDKYSAEILGATPEPRSARELSDRLDVPIATCYRRIRALSDCGLLAPHGENTDRPPADTFRRNVDAVTVEFGRGDVSVSVTERSAMKHRIDDAWRSLSDSG